MEQSHPEIEHEEKIDSNNEYLIWNDDNKWQWRYWWKWAAIWFAMTFLATLLGNYIGNLFAERFAEFESIFPAFSFLTWDQIVFTIISVLVISSAQWAVLKYHIEDAYSWIFYSIGGHLLASFLYPVLVERVFFPLTADIGGFTFYFLFSLMSILISTATAFIQFLLLRNWFYKAGTWVVIVLVGAGLQILMMLGISFIGQNGGGSLAFLTIMERIAISLSYLFSTFAIIYLLQREFEIDAEFRGLIEVEIEPVQEAA